MPSALIRPAAPGDAGRISAVYAPYVLNTLVSFELTPPSAGEMAGRMRALEGQFPWLVYESGGGVQGYCYAARFGERRGFDWSVETSIYMAHSFQGRGAGRKLYTALLHLLAMQGLRTAYARIGWPNPQSEGFHAGLGFSVEGLLKTAGYKFGQSAGIALYAKTLLPVRANPPAPVPFSALPAGPVAQVLARAAGEATE